MLCRWCYDATSGLFVAANSGVKTNSVNLLQQEVKMGKHIRWIYSSSLFIHFVVYSHKICQNDASPSNMSKKGSHCCLWWWRKDHIFSIISAFVTQIHFLPTTEYHIFRNYIQSLKQSISEWSWRFMFHFWFKVSEKYKDHSSHISHVIRNQQIN